MENDDRLIYMISEAQKSLMGQLKDRLLAEGLRVSPVQAGVLFLLLIRDGRTMTELSRHLLIDNSAITRLVDKMEKEGWVRRGTAPGDRRALLIHISEKGRSEALRAREIVRAFNEEIKSGLTGDELETLKKILGRWTRTYRREG